MARRRDDPNFQIKVENQAEWETVLAKEGLIVIDVYQKWSGPCASLVSYLKNVKNVIGGELLHFVVAKADTVDELENYRNKCEPCFLFYAGGTLVEVIRGADLPRIIRTIRHQYDHEIQVRQGLAERQQVVDPAIAKLEKERRDAERQKIQTENAKQEDERKKPPSVEKKRNVSDLGSETELQNIAETIKEEVANVANRRQVKASMKEKENAKSHKYCVLIIKPSAVQDGKTQPIIDELVKRNIKIISHEEKMLSEKEARRFYSTYYQNEELDDITKNAISAPSHVLVVWKHGDIFEEMPNILGPEDVEEAKRVAPYSLRAQFGTKHSNAVESSRTRDQALEDITIFFPNLAYAKEDKVSLERMLVIVRQDDHAEVLVKLGERGLEVLDTDKVILDEKQITGLYSDQKDTDVCSLADKLSQGPMVVMALEGLDVHQQWETCVQEIVAERQNTIGKENTFADIAEALQSSRSKESANIELGMFFPDLPVRPFEPREKIDTGNRLRAAEENQGEQASPSWYDTDTEYESSVDRSSAGIAERVYKKRVFGKRKQDSPLVHFSNRRVQIEGRGDRQDFISSDDGRVDMLDAGEPREDQDESRLNDGSSKNRSQAIHSGEPTATRLLDSDIDIVDTSSLDPIHDKEVNERVYARRVFHQRGRYASRASLEHSGEESKGHWSKETEEYNRQKAMGEIFLEKSDVEVNTVYHDRSAKASRTAEITAWLQEAQKHHKRPQSSASESSFDDKANQDVSKNYVLNPPEREGEVLISEPEQNDQLRKADRKEPSLMRRRVRDAKLLSSENTGYNESKFHNSIETSGRESSDDALSSSSDYFSNASEELKYRSAREKLNGSTTHTRRTGYLRRKKWLPTIAKSTTKPNDATDRSGRKNTGDDTERTITRKVERHYRHRKGWKPTLEEHEDIEFIEFKRGQRNQYKDDEEDKMRADYEKWLKSERVHSISQTQTRSEIGRKSLNTDSTHHNERFRQAGKKDTMETQTLRGKENIVHGNDPRMASRNKREQKKRHGSSSRDWIENGRQRQLETMDRVESIDGKTMYEDGNSEERGKKNVSLTRAGNVELELKTSAEGRTDNESFTPNSSKREKIETSSTKLPDLKSSGSMASIAKPIGSFNGTVDQSKVVYIGDKDDSSIISAKSEARTKEKSICSKSTQISIKVSHNMKGSSRDVGPGPHGVDERASCKSSISEQKVRKGSSVSLYSGDGSKSGSAKNKNDMTSKPSNVIGKSHDITETLTEASIPATVEANISTSKDQGKDTKGKLKREYTSESQAYARHLTGNPNVKEQASRENTTLSQEGSSIPWVDTGKLAVQQGMDYREGAIIIPETGPFFAYCNMYQRNTEKQKGFVQISICRQGANSKKIHTLITSRSPKIPDPGLATLIHVDSIVHLNEGDKVFVKVSDVNQILTQPPFSEYNNFGLFSS